MVDPIFVAASDSLVVRPTSVVITLGDGAIETCLSVIFGRRVTLGEGTTEVCLRVAQPDPLDPLPPEAMKQTPYR